MLQTIIAPNAGHQMVYHFADGAAVWGQAIMPSIAHFLQTNRDIAIDYSRIGAGIVFEALPGTAMFPHVIDAKRLRLHAEAEAFRHAIGRPDASVEATLRCRLGNECVLKLWGRVCAEEPLAHDKTSAFAEQGTDSTTVPVVFTVTFWEISRAAEATMRTMATDIAEKNNRIRELELKVAASMCSQ